MVIPNKVTAIGDWAFYRCPSLTSIVIPNSTVSIGANAFNGCSKLASATIGSSVRTINEKAFSNCPDLADIYCNAIQVPSISSDAFEDSFINLATLHVPDALLSSYKSTALWSSFGTIVGDGGSGDVPKCAVPTINYVNGEIVFGCETEGVEYVSEIVAPDAKKYNKGNIVLENKYIVSVYATKAGYVNSDVATKEIDLSNGGASSGIIGDVNGDGVVDAADIVQITNIIMGK